jgi:prepilin signal peptidase PulO-like enzyme (type II secretory pathway)
MLLGIVISAVVLGSAAFLGMQLSDLIGSRSGRPKPESDPVVSQRLTIALSLGSALVGGFLASRGVALVPFVLLALVCVCLCAAWYSDTKYGFIPDYFTVLPLVAVLGVAIFQHEFSWSLIASSFAAFLPFGLAALLSKGRGMGWGDSKLAALGGAMLGFQMSLIAFAAACLMLVAVGWISGKRGEPAPFAPYLAVAILGGVLIRITVAQA